MNFPPDCQHGRLETLGPKKKNNKKPVRLNGSSGMKTVRLVGAEHMMSQCRNHDVRRPGDTRLEDEL